MSRVTGPTSVFIDLDNTLYNYQAREKSARRDLIAKASHDLRISTHKVSKAYESARTQVKSRNGESASSHSRLCYISEMFVQLGLRQKPGQILELENTYWQSFLSELQLDSGVSEFIALIRQRMVPLVLITDLTLEIQYRKLIRLNLDSSFDFIIASEECGADKISGLPFTLAFSRLSESELQFPWFIGDSIHDDGGAYLQDRSIFFMRNKYTKFTDVVNRDETVLFREFGQLSKYLN
jgi:putative hydrolase of the HAD superfamily